MILFVPRTRSVCPVVIAILFAAQPAAFAAEDGAPEVVEAEEPATPLVPDAGELPGPDASGPEASPNELSADTVLDLGTAQRMALEGNPSLQAAEARVAQATARIRQAMAAYYPELSARMNATKTWLDENSIRERRRQETIRELAGAGQGSTPANQLVTTLGAIAGAARARGQVPETARSYSARLEAVWVLFDGFRRDFQAAAARYNEQELESALLNAQRIIVNAVANAYYNALLGREAMAIAEADAEFNERQLYEAQARRRVGTGSLSDELNFEVRLNQARTNLLDAQLSYQLALIGLSELIGIPDDRLLGDDVVLAPLEEPDDTVMDLPEPEALINFALNQRPDVRQRELTVQRAEAGIGVSRSAFYPQVSVFASKDAQSGQKIDFGRRDFSTSAGMTVTYEIFAGGRNRARLQEARAARTEAQHELTAVEIQVAQDIHQFIEELDTALATLRIQRENASFVQRNRDLVQREYAAGVGSLVRLNEAQRDLVQAQGNLVRAKVGVWHAWHNLQTATGETLARIQAYKTAAAR